jgi:aryl-alcohol dehydrogenase-like predicted oxidoreductase
MINKIVIGTANFGLNYGINNSKGKVSDDDIIKILLLAEKLGICIVDTAQAYGDAEERIGIILKKIGCNFKIVTKLKPSFKENINDLIFSSQIKIGSENLYGVLYHDFQDFKNNQNSYSQLSMLKDKQKIEKVGFSVYYPSEIEYLFENNLNFDIVQIPYSVFDNRFNYLLPKLKKHNIEIHTRSTFLQGLSFMNANSLPNNLMGARKSIELLNMISKENKIPISALCLNFVLNNKFVDKVVIGIDSVLQLKQNLMDIKRKSSVRKVMNQLIKLSISDEKIVLPFNWKKND